MTVHTPKDAVLHTQSQTGFPRHIRLPHYKTINDQENMIPAQGLNEHY